MATTLSKKIWNGGSLEHLPHRDLFYRDDVAAGIVPGCDPDHDRMFESRDDAAKFGINLRRSLITRLRREIKEIESWAKEGRGTGRDS